MEEKDKLTEVPQNNEEVVDVQTVEQTEEVAGNEKTAPVEVVVETKKERRKKKAKEEDLSEFENLSDDELYAKIQTQKLLMKKKRRKITTIIGMAFAFALAVCVIVLAALPVSLQPSCIKTGFTNVALFPGTANGVAYDDDEDGYKEFMKVYNNAFSQSYFSAIFNGSLTSYEVEEKQKLASNVIGSGGSLNQSGTYYVRLRFSEEQVLTTRNGSEYKSVYRNKIWPSGKLTFTEVYIEISEEKGFQDTNFHFVVQYPDSDGNLSETQRLVTFSFKANTYEIYNSWDHLSSF